MDSLWKMKSEENEIYLHHLEAQIKKQTHSSAEHIQKICTIKLHQLKNFVFSESFLEVLHPSFMLEVVKEFIHYSRPSKNLNNSEVYEILRIIVQSCPGLDEALFSLAKIEYLNGNINNALTNLEFLVSKTDNPESEAFIVMAQIQLQLGFYDKAEQTLEVSNNLFYNLILISLNYIVIIYTTILYLSLLIT